MEPRSERITWRTLVGFLALASVIAVVAIPTATWLDSAERPLVIRLAVVLFSFVALFRMVRVVREEARVGRDLKWIWRRCHVPSMCSSTPFCCASSPSSASLLGGTWSPAPFWIACAS